MVWHEILRVVKSVRSDIEEIKHTQEIIKTNMATFEDLQAIATQIVNDNTANNNAISAQLGEVSQLLTDYAAAVAAGQPIDPTALQTVISQLRSVDSLVQSNTAAIQASSAKITAADPAAAGTVGGPASGSDAGSGSQTTGSDGSAAPASPAPASGI